MGSGCGLGISGFCGYYRGLAATGVLAPRWNCWFFSMVFSLFIVCELLVDPEFKSQIGFAQAAAVLSWRAYPVVYLFPMLSFDADSQLCRF